MIGIIVNIIIGGIIGWIASMIMKTDEQMGKIANIIVGVVGANLGFWLAGMIGLGGGAIVRYAVALVGAVILIWLLKLFGVFK